MDSAKEKLLVDKVVTAFSGEITATDTFRGDVTHTVKKNSLKSLCTYLRIEKDLGFNYLVDVLGVDRNTDTKRFEVVYVFYSIPNKQRIRVKVQLDDGESIPTVTDIWRGANWPEREVYDMFGIVFDNHPDLRRIYLEDDWEGYPLRKDYPLRGYKDEFNPNGEERE
ncbi:MAG: NADH-quinone oxidoreductase subunit C [Proteobacteria bacterium]|nr:NADH-quinone oxidoreductase subunit C [Pseudomonadota bacterium]